MDTQFLNTDRLKSLLSSDDENHEKYVSAINSIDKHIRYCEYHHNQSIALFSNTSTIDENGYENALKIQAHAIAHLQSLHALVDSIPYAILLLKKEEIDITEKAHNIKKENKLRLDQISLHKRYVDRFSLTGLDVTILQKALGSQQCKDLRDYINQLKHRYIDDFSIHENEIFIYTSESKSFPLKEYLTSTHNHIVFELVLPFYKNLYNP